MAKTSDIFVPADFKMSAPDPLLVDILSTRRAHGSVGDINFRTWLKERFIAYKVECRHTEVGNLIVTIGADHKTLFSCHVDTVHGFNESATRQELVFDEVFGHICLADKKQGSCLGADDGAGIYVLLKMIEAGVNGTYIFHVGEDMGGIGAFHMAEHEAAFLKKFDRAVAFDRAGDFEVIATQGGQDCASMEFATLLAKALSVNGMQYEVSHKGTFTDTKVYRYLIPECVNLGVGYYNQHGPDEYLDVMHLSRLVQTCIELDWEKLKVSRKPAKPQPKLQATPPNQPYKKFKNDESYRYPRDETGLWSSGLTTAPKKAKAPVYEPQISAYEELMQMNYDEIDALCTDDPSVAADMIVLLLGQLAAAEAKAETLEKFFK
jgi:hypothetical protein